MLRSPNTIYLDACATTRPRQEVVNIISSVMKDQWGNPSSIHRLGIDSTEVLERSRIIISEQLGSDREDLIFCSGATESVHLALLGAASKYNKGRVVISSVEHPSVQAAANKLVKEGWELATWPVDSKGRVDLSHLERLLSNPTKIVSLIWGQGEVGTLQPIDIIGKECRSRNITFHTDASQVMSFRTINWSTMFCDLLSFSSHKLQGPKGIGLLLKRKGIFHTDFKFKAGGGQQNDLCAGTEPVALIAGMAEALRILSVQYNLLSLNKESELQRVAYQASKLRQLISCIPGTIMTGDQVERIPHHISFLASNSQGKPLDGRRIVRQLSDKGIYISSGTACKASIVSDSDILKAMNIDNIWLKSGLRISLANELSSSELEYISDMLKSIILV